MLLGWPNILVCQGLSGFPGHRTFSAKTRTISDNSGQLLPTAVWKGWRRCALFPVVHYAIAFVFWTFSTPTIRVDYYGSMSFILLLPFLAVGVKRLRGFKFYLYLLWVLICHPMATRGIECWRNHAWLMSIYMTTVLRVGGETGARRGTR